jgi:prevent-host-death family protein
VNLYEAKSHLSELVERAAAGEEIVIAKAGTPRAKLVALVDARPARRPGRAKGRIRIASDFDAPLPEDLGALAAAAPLQDSEAAIRPPSRARAMRAKR